MKKVARKKLTVQVRFTLPPGVTPMTGVAYVREAVRAWSGSFQPPGVEEGPFGLRGDPRFGMGRDATTSRVTARLGPKPKRRQRQ